MPSQEGCKVDVMTERYGLDEATPRYDTVDDYLLARWTGADGRPADGYRTIAEWFNKRLLKRTYDEHGRSALATRVDTEYEALTGDDELLRQEVADDLRADDIDPDALREDMLSWSTMRHHLKGCIDGEKARENSDSEWERESIDIARDHARAKVEDALRSLAGKDDLSDADQAEVTVQVHLSCPECPTRVPLDDALARGYVCSDHVEAIPNR